MKAKVPSEQLDSEIVELSNGNTQVGVYHGRRLVLLIGGEFVPFYMAGYTIEQYEDEGGFALFYDPCEDWRNKSDEGMVFTKARVKEFMTMLDKIEDKDELQELFDCGEMTREEGEGTVGKGGTNG